MAKVSLAQAGLGIGLRSLKGKEGPGGCWFPGARVELPGPKVRHSVPGCWASPGQSERPPSPCAPVVMGLLAFCNGSGVGRRRTHASCGDPALPVFTGARLAAADVETGAAAAWLAPGWALRPSPEGSEWAHHPHRLQTGAVGNLRPPSPPFHCARHPPSTPPSPTASAQRKRPGGGVALAQRAGGPRGQRSGQGARQCGQH